MKSKNQYLSAEGIAGDWEEAIRLCGEEIVANGYVETEFIAACIEREKEYPTGLPAPIPVAIPHSRVEGIYENSICMMRFLKPVRFYRMDDSDEYVDTQLVFNLALKAEDHLEFLQNLMAFVMNADAIKKCMELPLEDIPEFLEKELG